MYFKWYLIALTFIWTLGYIARTFSFSSSSLFNGYTYFCQSHARLSIVYLPNDTKPSMQLWSVNSFKSIFERYYRIPRKTLLLIKNWPSFLFQIAMNYLLVFIKIHPPRKIHSIFEKWKHFNSTDKLLKKQKFCHSYFFLFACHLGMKVFYSLYCSCENEANCFDLFSLWMSTTIFSDDSSSPFRIEKQTHENEHRGMRKTKIARRKIENKLKLCAYMKLRFEWISATKSMRERIRRSESEIES